MKRKKTKFIAVHVLGTATTGSDASHINTIFLRLGLPSSPFHFILLPNGEIEDGRDVMAVGAYSPHNLDIAVLCANQPSPTQEERLRELIAALLQDYSSDEKPEVISIERMESGGGRERP